MSNYQNGQQNNQGQQANRVKRERQYEILCSLFDSKYPSAIYNGKSGFRVVANKVGSGSPARLEVKIDMLDKTLRQILQEEREAYEAYKAEQGQQPAPAYNTEFKQNDAPPQQTPPATPPQGYAQPSGQANRF